MTEATKRPWYATGIHVQSAAINEDNYVCTAEGDTPETAVANADLIVNAVNSHDALVQALEAVEFAAGFPINDTCPACGALEKNSHRVERGHERHCQLAAALEQVK